MRALLFYHPRNGSKKEKTNLMERKIENRYKGVGKLFANFILPTGCTEV